MVTSMSTRSLREAAAALLDGLTDAVCLVTHEGRVLAATAPAARLWSGNPCGAQPPYPWWPDAAERLAEVAAAGVPRTLTVGAASCTVRIAPVPGLEMLRLTLPVPAADARVEASDMQLLQQVAQAMAREEEPGRVMELVAEVVAATFGADSGRVARFVEGSAEVVGTWGTGSPPLGARFPLAGSRAVAQVAATGRAARVDDYVTLRATEPVSRQYVAPVYHAGIAAPIRSAGRLWGAILVVSAEHGFRFPPGAEHRLEELGALMGMAIAGASTRGGTRPDQGDPITGLPGRRAFETRLAAEVEHARTAMTPLSVVIADVDGFRRVNEALGLGEGDRVLAEIARRLVAALPAGTTIARFGGNEFAWILPGVGARPAAHMSRGACRAVAARPAGQAGVVTLSAGVCDLDAASGGHRELMQLADVALFSAKHAAPGSVRRYSPGVVEVVSASEQARRIARHRALCGIRTLARAVDARDPTTQRHSERVASLAAELARELGWAEEAVARITDAALVHDVGKIGVPDSVLLKPGPLDPEERATVQTHAALGAEIVGEVLSAEQVDWVRHHHERPGGGGYPDNLRGHGLSEGARILALADAFDAMTEDRGYRSKLTVAEAVAECEVHAGTQFCPRVVAALRRLHDAGALDGPSRVSMRRAVRSPRRTSPRPRPVAS